MESINLFKKYKEEKRSNKLDVKAIRDREKSLIRSSNKVANLAKKVSQGKLIRKRIFSDENRSVYIMDYIKSRWYEIWDTIICEYTDCKNISVDIHHINSSFRGTRKHNIDWFDLIALCRHHHEEIHNCNNKEKRDKLLTIVKDVLKWIPVADTRLSKTKFWRVRTNINRRCYEKTNDSYERYWWRGIKNEWKSLREFRDSMYLSYIEHCEKFWQKNTSIERINVNGNYNEENCKRATPKEQANNRTNNIIINYQWKEYTLSQICEMKSLNKITIQSRIKKHWRDIDKAINTPVDKSKRNKNAKLF